MVKGTATTKRKHQTQAPNASTKRNHQAQALMGATRPVSGIKEKAHTLLNKDSQTALITCLSVSLSLIPGAGRVAPIRAQFPGTTVLYMVSNLLFNL